MVQAMNTGHDGSISTVHANSPRDALNRLETMIQMAGFELPSRAMRQQISQALDVIVQTARLADGTRRVTSVAEVAGMEGDTIMLQELFTFHRESVDDGKIVGRLVSTGIRPRFAERVKASSHAVDPAAFDYLKGGGHTHALRARAPDLRLAGSRRIRARDHVAGPGGGQADPGPPPLDHDRGGGWHHACRGAERPPPVHDRSAQHAAAAPRGRP